MTYSSVSIKEFQCPTALNRATVARMGMHSGNTNRVKRTIYPAPSMEALSSSAGEIDSI